MSVKATRSINMLISVVIPAYNSAAFLPSLLQTLKTNTVIDFEIIVVDDGSSDSTRAIAEARGVMVIQTAHRQSGPAVARNHGAKAAHGDVLFFLDADVLPHSDALERVHTAFMNDVRLDAVFGSYDDQPTENNFLSQYKNLFHHYMHQQGNEEATTFWTGCGAIRRQVFLKLGGFTNDYGRPCIEDIELGYRLSKQGGRIRLDKDLQVTHHKRWKPLNLIKVDIFDRGIPWAELILRHRAFDNDLNLQSNNRISVVVLWSCILCAMMSFIDYRFLALAFSLALLLLGLNWQLYRWFNTKRGLIFTLKVVPWHWCYYAYNAIAFALGVFVYLHSAFARGHLHPHRHGELLDDSEYFGNPKFDL